MGLEILAIAIGGVTVALGFNFAVSEFYMWRERVYARHHAIEYHPEVHG